MSGRLEQQVEPRERGERTQRVKAQGVARGPGQEGAEPRLSSSQEEGEGAEVPTEWGQEDRKVLAPPSCPRVPGTRMAGARAARELTWVSPGGQVRCGPGPRDSSPPPLLSVDATLPPPCPAERQRTVPVAGPAASPSAPQPDPARPSTRAPGVVPTVSSNSSFSLRARRGHQPLTRFCLKIETRGTSTSPVAISMVHCLAVLAPRGNRFRSSSMAPVATLESVLTDQWAHPVPASPHAPSACWVPVPRPSPALHPGSHRRRSGRRPRSAK